MANLPHLLCLTAHLPAEQSHQAGQKTAFRNLRWLAEKYNVHLVSFRSEGDRPEAVKALEKICAGVEVFGVTRSKRIQGLLGSPWLPLAIAARRNSEVRNLVSKWCQNHDFARVHMEWSQ